MKLKSKLFASAVAFTMVLSMAAIPAAAQTTAELTAQINSLLAMIAQLQAQIAGGAGATAGHTFTTDLTVGSKGAEVTALQTFLVSKGFLTMPAGVAMGTFGPLTKAALAAYQTSAGISPAAGYFGPLTRAKVNALAVVPGTPGTPVVPGTITTPGVEGTLTVTNSTAGLVSTAYEGDSKDAVLGFKVEAKTSDIAVQRVKVALSDSSKVYNAIYSKMYVTDANGNVLASSDLNSSTVVKEGTEYYITLAGFSYVVPKNTTKQMYVKADLYSSIDSTDISNFNLNSHNVIHLADSGIRGVDGAGIDQYSPTTGTDVTKTITIAATLTDSAALKVSLNSSTPVRNDVVASGGTSENELDKLAILVFDLKAEKDTILITDMRVGAVRSSSTSGAANPTTAYLYDGSTELDNATITSGMATFNDINLTVSKDTTKTLTLKVDVRSANGVVENITGYASTTAAADLVAENSAGVEVTPSGSATGNAVGVRNVGPEITLVSKSVTTDGVPQGAGSNTNSTSTLSATFNIKIKAVGGDLMFGTSQATSSPLFSSTTSFGIYRNGSAVTSLSSAATSTSFTIPTTCAAGTLTASCTLAEGSEITVPVTFGLQGRSNQTGAFTAGLYAIDIAQINWLSATVGSYNSTFMSGLTDWRTADVSFP
jgi:hypothetical protein